MESIKQQLGDNPILSIFCAILVLITPLFFGMIYVAGYKQRQARKRNRRHFERDLARVRRKKKDRP